MVNKITIDESQKIVIPELIKKVTRPILQNKTINTLVSSNNKSFNKDGELITDAGTFKLNNGKDFKLATSKVFLYLLAELTSKIPQRKDLDKLSEYIKDISKIKIIPKEYAETCGLKDLKTAREDIKTAINTLKQVTITTTDYKKIDGKTTIRTDVTFNLCKTITDETVVSNNKFRNPNAPKRVPNNSESLKSQKEKLLSTEVCFSEKFIEYLSRQYILPFPMVLLKVNGRKYSHALYFGFKLINHYNMNYSKKNESIIKISNLLKSSPNMPDYEEVMSKRRQIHQLIKEPLEKNLECLFKIGLLKSWSYSYKGQVAISDEEALTIKSSDIIKDGYIIFELSDTYKKSYNTIDLLEIF